MSVGRSCQPRAVGLPLFSSIQSKKENIDARAQGSSYPRRVSGPLPRRLLFVLWSASACGARTGLEGPPDAAVEGRPGRRGAPDAGPGDVRFQPPSCGRHTPVGSVPLRRRGRDRARRHRRRRDDLRALRDRRPRPRRGRPRRLRPGALACACRAAHPGRARARGRGPPLHGGRRAAHEHVRRHRRARALALRARRRGPTAVPRGRCRGALRRTASGARARAGDPGGHDDRGAPRGLRPRGPPDPRRPRLVQRERVRRLGHRRGLPRHGARPRRGPQALVGALRDPRRHAAPPAPARDRRRPHLRRVLRAELLRARRPRAAHGTGALAGEPRPLDARPGRSPHGRARGRRRRHGLRLRERPPRRRRERRAGRRTPRRHPRLGLPGPTPPAPTTSATPRTPSGARA